MNLKNIKKIQQQNGEAKSITDDMSKLELQIISETKEITTSEIIKQSNLIQSQIQQNHNGNDPQGIEEKE